MGKDKVTKTYNYDQFKLIPTNRKVRGSHVARLVESIERNNLLHLAPILVTKDHYVIDGQHRLYAAKALHTPVFYKVIDSVRVDDPKTADVVTSLNEASKTWETKDYLAAYIERGDENYMILNDFSRKYKISVPIAVDLLSGRSVRKGGGKRKMFIRGEFKVVAYEEAVEFAEKLTIMYPFIKKFFADRSFVAAVQRMFNTKGFDFKKFLRKLQNHGDIEKQASTTQYLRCLEELYNKNERHDIRFD